MIDRRARARSCSLLDPRRTAGRTPPRARSARSRACSCSRSTTSTVISQPATPGHDPGRLLQRRCVDSAGVQTGWTQKTVPTGGIEYLATHIKALRTANSNTITVGAGDLIGASPLVSALFHDEPTIEALNAHRARRQRRRESRVRRGRAGAAPHAVRRLPPRRRVPGRRRLRRCRTSSTSRRTSFYEGTDETILPPYEVKEDRRREDRVHRPHARGHADDRDARRPSRASSSVREVETVNALVHELAAKDDQGVRRAAPPGWLAVDAGSSVPGPRTADAYIDVNRCVNFNGPEITSIANGLDDRVNVVVSAPHAPAVHLHDRRQAGDERCVLRAAWSPTST